MTERQQMICWMIVFALLVLVAFGILIRGGIQQYKGERFFGGMLEGHSHEHRLQV